MVFAVARENKGDYKKEQTKRDGVAINGILSLTVS